MKSSTYIYESLLKHRVKHAFLYSGGSIMPLVDEFYRGSIKYYVNNHEQNCCHAATGYAKASGETGIAIVTSGPGVTNSITGLLDATNDSTPFILISGQVSTSAIGTNAFQEAPATEITHHVTKKSFKITHENQLENVMDEAFDIANHGKKGAVHIDIPKNILVKPINWYFNRKKYYGEWDCFLNPKHNTKYNAKYSQEIFRTIANIINIATAPILYVGQGANNYSDLLREFSIKGNIPVTTTIHAMGTFDETHELSLQFLGMHGNPAANFAMQKSDCIIAFGSRFDDRTTGNIDFFAPNAKNIIHVNIEQSEIGKVVKSNHNFVMDCGEFMQNIIPYILHNKRAEWIAYINEQKNKHYFEYDMPKNYKLNTQVVIDRINTHFIAHNTKNYIVTTGVGNHQMMAAQYIKWKYPKSFISSGSLGVMGVGLPYAIGAQIAYPDKLVLCIDGDGSFCHTFGDLQSVVRYNLPIKIAIMNDGNQSMVRAWEQLFFDSRFTATSLPCNPDFCKLAESYGIHSIKCDNIDKLNETIDYFLNYKGSILCDFRVQSELCLPLVAPGKALDDMIFSCDKKIQDIVMNGLVPS